MPPSWMIVAPPIHANSGDIIRSGDTWYWFGEDMTEYTWPSATPGSVQWYAEFKGVNCYKSKDLVHWTFSNVVLKKQPAGKVGPNREVSRPHVVWNAKTKKWVMLYHAENLLYDENRVGIATCDTIDGDYTFIKTFRPGGERSLDLGVYQEGEDCYIVYSWANSGQRIDKLTPDYMEVAANVFSIKEQGEAPVIIKREGVYYWVNSELTGWDPNPNFYRTATSLAGPWSKKQPLAPDSNNTYGSQVFEVIQADDFEINGVRGGCIFVGDLFDLKHFANSKTLWLPVEFTAGNHMALKKRDSWKLRVTGPASTSSSTSPQKRLVVVGDSITVGVGERPSASLFNRPRRHVARGGFANHRGDKTACRVGELANAAGIRRKRPVSGNGCQIGWK